MRKIEEQATRAFLNRKTWRKNNTSTGLENGRRWGLRLHNNLIAVLHDDGTVVVNNCGWESRTTQSRLNALCVALGMRSKIGIKNWIMYIEDVQGNMQRMAGKWWIIKQGKETLKDLSTDIASLLDDLKRDENNIFTVPQLEQELLMIKSKIDQITARPWPASRVI